MAAGDFNFNGWTTHALIPSSARKAKVEAGLKATMDASLASRKGSVAGTQASGTTPTTSDFTAQQRLIDAAKTGVQTIDAPAQGQPIAERLAALNLGDSTLGSRTQRTATPGIRGITAQGSVYSSADIPSFLTGAVQQLNSTTLLQAAAREELLNRIMGQAEGGNFNAWDALRAAVVSPNANVTFGSGITDPAKGQAAVIQSAAVAQNLAAKTSAVNKASSAASSANNSWELDKLRQQLAAESNKGFGLYNDALATELRNKISALEAQAQPNSSTQQLGRAAASGWTPTLPTY